MNERRWAVGLVLSICMVGCHASDDSAAPAASASAAPSSAASALAQHPRRRTGGLEGLIFNAAHDLPTLTDAQKVKIDAAEEEVPNGMDPGPRDAAKAFSTDLAAQIRAGKVDMTKLQTDETAMDTALNAILDQQAKALSDLHDALDVGQRTTVATNLHASMSGAGPDPATLRDAGPPADRVARQVDRMATDLTLDDSQKKQITAVLLKDEKAKDAKPPQDHRKDLDVVLSAFQGDPFDAKTALSQAKYGGKPPHEGMDDQIKLTSDILPILHPDQREKLAAAAERPPMPPGMQGMHGPGMGGGMRGPGMMRGLGGPRPNGVAQPPQQP